MCRRSYRTVKFTYDPLCLQDERGEDPSNTFFCSLPKDAPSDRRAGSKPDDRNTTSNGLFSVFALILA